MTNADKLLHLALFWACTGGIILIGLTGALVVKTGAGWADVVFTLAVASELLIWVGFMALGLWETFREILRGEY